MVVAPTLILPYTDEFHTRIQASGSWGERGDHEQLFRISESLQRMHWYAEWIGEKIGAESSRIANDLKPKPVSVLEY